MQQLGALFSLKPQNFSIKIFSEKICYIFSKESFSYICGNGAQARKIKKIHPEKISAEKAFLIFQKTTTPEFLIFSQKKAFSIFQEKETSKKIIYISGNGILLYFRK